MPPKRKSNSSSAAKQTPKSKPTAPATATATQTQPTSSDGPTLPIITTAPSPPSTVPAKRKANASASGDEKEEVAASGPRNAKEKKKEDNGGKSESRKGNTLHPSLYTPWDLLPPQLRWEGCEAEVEVVAWSKNQNVRAGVNRVKGFVASAASTSAGTETGAQDGQDGEAGLKGARRNVLAISSQGEGTAKMVGIMEVARRVLEAPCASPSDGDQAGEKIEYFVYTALSGVHVAVPPPKPQSNSHSNAQRRSKSATESNTLSASTLPTSGSRSRDGEGGEGDGDESDDAFENPMDSRAGKAETRSEPVLTVWLSRRRFAGFAGVFGEEVWRVGV